MTRPLPPLPKRAGSDLRNQYSQAVETRRRANLARAEADRLARIAEQAETAYCSTLMEFNGQTALPIE